MHGLLCHILVPSRSDYSGTWKLHEQQQKRSSVWIQTAKFRSGKLLLSAFEGLLQLLCKCLLEVLLSFQLLDTKSTDRKLTLLHYIANVVKEKYAQVALFYNELHYVEKAAAGESRWSDVLTFWGRHASLMLLLVFAVSLENVLLDVKELNRGMELTKREYSMHGHNTMLKDFIAHNESKLKKLQDDTKIAQVT